MTAIRLVVMSLLYCLQVNRKNKVKDGESSDESEGETVTETQQVSCLNIIQNFHRLRPV